MSSSRAQGEERAILVHIQFPDSSIQEDLQEFEELARSAGANQVSVITGTYRTPQSKFFVGSGKVVEIQNAIHTHKADLVLFNHALTPAQERNLEKKLQCRVLDRTGLILDIFAQRARSFEGKLQVELALLTHLSTRLIRGWTHLERQRGGIGLRGPGETQLEIDRRLIRRRIQYIKKRLLKVKEQRSQSRRARSRAIIPTVALIGYTNAGKSTLFNKLSGSQVYVADRLFATLDPTLRRIEIPEIGPIILADTVGFIRHLPHDLIEAFKATLEEVAEADLLLHVIDAHDPRRKENSTEVNKVLSSIRADKVPQLAVLNKTDLLQTPKVGIDRHQDTKIKAIWISALTQTGLVELKEAISESLGGEIIQRSIILAPNEAKLRADLYRLKAVYADTVDEQGYFHLLIKLKKAQFNQLLGEQSLDKPLTKS